MDVLFGFVAPLAAKKIMSKSTGLHAIFRKTSIHRPNIDVHALTFDRTLGRC